MRILIGSFCAAVSTISTINFHAPYYNHMISRQASWVALLVFMTSVYLLKFSSRHDSRLFHQLDDVPELLLQFGSFLITASPLMLPQIAYIVLELHTPSRYASFVGAAINALSAAFVAIWAIRSNDDSPDKSNNISKFNFLLFLGLYCVFTYGLTNQFSFILNSSCSDLVAASASLSFLATTIATYKYYTDRKKHGSSEKKARKTTKRQNAKYAFLSPSLSSLQLVIIIIHWSLVAVFINGSIYQVLVPQCHAPMSSFEHHPYKILNKSESLTGYISVVEAPSPSSGTIRIMRCDHSLLGGIYLEYDNISIYSCFYLLGLSHVIKRHDESSKAAESKKALQLGLGIGIGANMLHDLGYEMQIVEIDPLVYTYAVQYFGLLKPSPSVSNGVPNPFIGDGRLFLEEVAEDGSFDLIMHDIFTGGVVPQTLVSVEAIKSVSRVLKSNGILAFNHVGNLDSSASASVIRTIRSVFKYVSCAVESKEVEDSLKYSGSKIDNAKVVYNMVFYASHYPIEFGRFSDKDTEKISRHPHYDMYTRLLENMHDHLIIRSEYIEKILGKYPDSLVITDNFNPLAASQFNAVETHWELLQTLFPTDFWLNAF